MILPALAAWLKQKDLASGLWVSGSATRLFAERTGNAGECKIIRRCLAAGVGGDDVIDMESSFLPYLGEAAIFAAAGRAPFPSSFRALRADRGVYRIRT